MDSIKCRSLQNPNNRSKLAKTFQKVINLKTATRIASTNGIGFCILPPQQQGKPHNNYESNDDVSGTICSKKRAPSRDTTALKRNAEDKRRAALQALIAKLFAEITGIKAGYAQLQMAQNPYRSEAIQSADQSVVDSLIQLSELKHKYHQNDIDHLHPQVTLMLAEIQEQQSLMKTFEITIKKLESEVEAKSSLASSLRVQLNSAVLANKKLETKLNSSGAFSMFDNVQLRELNLRHFVQFLHYTIRSVRSFVKLMVGEMESASWDIELAIKAIELDANLWKPSHRCFVFESFVCKTMFKGFNNPNFVVPNESPPPPRELYFSKFKKITKFKTLKQFLSTQSAKSSFSRFLRGKYLSLVHAKMECSLFGNLNQRKMVSGGGGSSNNGFPESSFFLGLAEMARRVWCLNYLAFSFGFGEVGVFQVRKGCRFSEVYMESVTEECGGGGEGEVTVGFTVVPGFKIGTNVVQCQVYLTPEPAVDSSVSG